MVVKRMSITFDDSVVELIEMWRKQQTKIPSFNKAVNQIINDGVSAIQWRDVEQTLKEAKTE
jgi:hypothetical protein